MKANGTAPMTQKERHQVEKLKIVNTRDRLKIELQENDWPQRRAVNESLAKSNGRYVAVMHRMTEELPEKLFRRDARAASKICRASLDGALETFCRARNYDDATS